MTKNHPFLHGEPSTEIEYEHFAWWYSLPRLWQSIFLISYRHPEYLEPQINTKNPELAGNGADIDFYLNYPVPLEISAEELAGIFELTAIAYNRGDVNPKRHTVVFIIPPLHYFKHLQYLSLDENYLDDLSGLQGLTKLKLLNIHENHVHEQSQLDYIAQLHSLEYLDISVNYFDDLSPLAQLTNLKHLEQWGSYETLVNISGFENLQNLQSLIMSAPLDVTPLASLKNLKELEFGTDEYDFDCSKIQWLCHQLPDCYIDYYLPIVDENYKVSDETFLWKIVLEKGERFYGTFDQQRFDDLVNKHQHSNDPVMRDLIEQAIYAYTHKWKGILPP